MSSQEEWLATISSGRASTGAPVDAHADAEQAAQEAVIDDRDAPPQRALQRDREPLQRHQRQRDQREHRDDENQAQHQRLDFSSSSGTA